MTSDIFGIMILILWYFIEVGFQWNDKYSTAINLLFGFIIFLTLGIIYWVPFWLFFMKG